jgi:diguanylate cyclase (GGDEF)-like protein/PAS domain S-box-containing protein
MNNIEALERESYLSIIENLHDGLYFVDKNRIITFWNKAAERISGYSSEEVVGKSCAENILTHVDCDGKYLCEKGCPLLVSIEGGGFHQSTMYMHHKDGYRIPVSVKVSPIKDKKGNIIGSMELFTDVSKQEKNELLVKELQKLALIDDLTNLANRRYIEQELLSRFEEAGRFQVPFGVLFMDIDHFKIFNDTYGHIVGDKVLRYVSKSFTANSRPFDLYGRWGGEEFVAIIRNVDASGLSKVGERVRVLIEKSYITEGDETLSVTISLGATMMQPGDTIDSLIKRSDTLLYQSKREGRNRLTLG